MSTDGKWCYIKFWVVGQPTASWSLLKKRLLEVCPSYISMSGIEYYRSEMDQPKPHDVFLLKFWCSCDRKGLLHGEIPLPLCPFLLDVNYVSDLISHTFLISYQILFLLESMLGFKVHSCFHMGTVNLHFQVESFFPLVQQSKL